MASELSPRGLFFRASYSSMILVRRDSGVGKLSLDSIINKLITVDQFNMYLMILTILIYFL